MSFLAELKRRNVICVAGLYLVGAGLSDAFKPLPLPWSRYGTMILA
jgi:hypothetical protein